MFIKKLIAATVAAATLVGFTACSTDLSSTAEESRTVMTVDEWEVPYEMYRYAAMMHLRDRTSAIAAEKKFEDSDISSVVAVLTDEEKSALATEIEEYSTDTIVDIYSIFTAAENEGIDPFGDMIDSLTDMEMEEIRATYSDDKEYLETIKGFYMNNSVYTVLTRYEIVFNQLYDEYVKNGKIDVSDEAAVAHMNGDDAARLKQILISFERHDPDEALAVAEDVLNELKPYISDDGVVDEDKFDELTDKYGEDLFMFKNRDGYYVPKGYVDEEFEAAGFALEIGNVSDVVRTSAGYSIIMRAEKDPEFIENNLDTLKDSCNTGIYRTLLGEFSANAKVAKNDEFKKIDVFTMK